MNQTAEAVKERSVGKEYLVPDFFVYCIDKQRGAVHYAGHLIGTLNSENHFKFPSRPQDISRDRLKILRAQPITLRGGDITKLEQGLLKNLDDSSAVRTNSPGEFQAAADRYFESYMAQFFQ